MQNAILARLLSYEDPILGAIFTKKSIKQLNINNGQIHINLVLPVPLLHSKQTLIERLLNWLKHVTDQPIIIYIESQIDAYGGENRQVLPQIKNIIAVASGKGGVGKSTIAVNVALALAKEGASVGLLDADIYGPSQAMMLGTKGQRPALKDEKLQPVQQHGIQSMSIAYLVDEHAPLVWRGPMIGKAMQQMLQETNWQALDYLIVDLPPGTGDIQLTLCQKMPVSGALIVTTPQDLALIDVRRACEMFAKLNVPILGVVENMSHYVCTHCSHEEKLFGEGGAKKIAEEYHVPLLGEVPLDVRIREMTDHGSPPVIQNDQEISEIFYQIALKTATQLTMQRKNYSAIFPKIVIQKDETI